MSNPPTTDLWSGLRSAEWAEVLRGNSLIIGDADRTLIRPTLISLTSGYSAVKSIHHFCAAQGTEALDWTVMARGHL